MTGFYGRTIPPEVLRFLRQGTLGGLLISRHNFRGPEGLAALCASIRAAWPESSPPLIAADQEGGPVAHLTPPLPNFPSMTALGAIDDVDLTHRIGAALGAELRACGVTFDLAPVLDVRTSRNNLVVLHRTFGSDPARVAQHGRALIDGLTAAGVLACAKHFPGHGDTAIDSHAALPRVAHGLARLDAVEFVPFRACVDVVPAVMLAHLVLSAVDRSSPASLSRPVIEDVLRARLGFEGVTMSDDLQMAAITRNYRIEDAAERAMRAGCDLLLIAHSSSVAMQVVQHLARRAAADAALCERLEQACARLRRMRARLNGPIPPNPYAVRTADVMREVRERLGRRDSGVTMRDPTARR